MNHICRALKKTIKFPYLIGQPFEKKHCFVNEMKETQKHYRIFDYIFG